MRKQMDRFVRDSMRAAGDSEFRNRPFVYGFTFRMGPDGIPRFEQFGDTRFGRYQSRRDVKDTKREPLTDIIESEEYITITMELPGIEKKDINLEFIENKLIIDVDTEARKYHKELKLPEKLDTENIQANYKNGVLDIKIMRKKEEKKKGKKIEIK